MTTTKIDRSGYRPSAFAWAVASLMTLDDTDEEQATGTIFLRKPASLGWTVWTRVTDWRVDEGDTLFGNFEVCDDGLGQARARARPFTRQDIPVRQAWAERKARELDELMRKLHRGEPSLLRWIAAVVDALPLDEFGEALEFKRSLVRDGIEVKTRRAVVSVRRQEDGEGWALRLDKVFGREPAITHTVSADEAEDNQVRDLLREGI